VGERARQTSSLSSKVLRFQHSYSSLLTTTPTTVTIRITPYFPGPAVYLTLLLLRCVFLFCCSKYVQLPAYAEGQHECLHCVDVGHCCS